MRHRRKLTSAAFLLSTLFAPICVQATTKGLNQIVTPDIQPAGQLSLSFQQQDPTIANRVEFQAELGITPRFEAAVFQGTSPAEQILNAEYGIYQGTPWLLSTGFLNWTTKGTQPQPFLEGGYYKGSFELIAGAIRVTSEGPGVGGAIRSFHETQSLIGGAYRVSPRLLTQLDYQSGAGNFATAGFTYNVTPAVALNPAVYISNASPHKGYGYVVVTWTVTAWK